jgi:Cellulase (glycosyl hydrolase family 5)
MGRRSSLGVQVFEVASLFGACALLGACGDRAGDAAPATGEARQSVVWPFMTKDSQQRLWLGADRVAGPAANLFTILHEYYVNPVLARAKLDRARQAGIRFARFWAAGLPVAGEYVMVQSWQNQAGHATYYAAFDALAADAANFGIQLIPSLLTGLYDRHENPSVCASRRTLPPNILDDSIGMVPGSTNKTILKNLFLGIAQRYKSSGAILFWELGNELNLVTHERSSNSCATRSEVRAWMQEVAAALKQVDPNHLVASGTIQEGSNDAWPLKGVPNAPGVLNDMQDFFTFYATNVPSVDLTSFHFYEPYVDGGGVVSQAADFVDTFLPASIAAGKALFVGEFGPRPGAWADDNFAESPMSVLLATSFRNVEIAAAWAWETRAYRDWDGPNSHPVFEELSLDPGEDDDFLTVMREFPQKMGKSVSQVWKPLVGNFDGSPLDDLAASSNRGLLEVSTMAATPQPPAAWLSQFGDDLRDIGGAPFQTFVGDWNQDGKTDIGAKSRDGRWFLADRDPDPTKKGFVNRRQLPGIWGDDNADPGGAPFTVFTGSWTTTDNRTDVGLKSRDGRWFLADMNGTASALVNPRQLPFVLGNDATDPVGAPYFPFTGDWNHDSRTDIGVKSRDGRWFLSRNLATGFTAPGVAVLSNWANDTVDVGGAPFRVVTGDWNADGRTDIGVKSRDGRWFFADMNPAATGFVNPRQVLSNWGNDTVDIGGAPFLPFTGQFTAGDARTDIGVKSNDGRWFVARTDASGMVTGSTAWLP